MNVRLCSTIILLISFPNLTSLSENNIVIKKGKTVTIDGILTIDEWDDSDSRKIEVRDQEIIVYFKHDGSNLLFTFNGLSSNPFRVPEVLLDLGNEKSKKWDGNDWWFHASGRDCWSDGRYNDYTTCVNKTDSWEANNVSGSSFPQIFEIKIPFSTINLSYKKDTEIGIAFDITDTSKNWEFWPERASITDPSSWGTAIIQLTK